MSVGAFMQSFMDCPSKVKESSEPVCRSLLFTKDLHQCGVRVAILEKDGGYKAILWREEGLWFAVWIKAMRSIPE